MDVCIYAYLLADRTLARTSAIAERFHRTAGYRSIIEKPLEPTIQPHTISAAAAASFRSRRVRRARGLLSVRVPVRWGSGDVRWWRCWRCGSSSSWSSNNNRIPVGLHGDGFVARLHLPDLHAADRVRQLSQPQHGAGGARTRTEETAGGQQRNDGQSADRRTGVD